MKQRLLLSLLMLFVSVGLVKAQTINITSTGEADAKVTLTSDAFTFVDVTNYPTYTGDGVTHKVTGKSVEYTIPKGKTTLAINTAANEWGNISIIVDGKVSSFALSEETALSKLITSLKFVNNGVLKGLTLGAGGGTMVYVPNLEYLDCQGNQLSRFPKMGEKMTAANYKIGEQTPSGVTLGTITGNAKTGVQLDASQIFGGWNSKPTDITGVSFAELKDADNNVVTSYAIQDETTPNKYFFKNGTIFVDGNYTAKVKIESETCPGIIICGIPVNVSAALFTLTVTSGEHGKIDANPAAGSTNLVKDQEVVLTPIPDEGYVFAGFTENPDGLTKVREDGNATVYKVIGNVDPVIKGTFVAGSSTITITQPQNGSIEVLDDNGNPVSTPAVGSNVIIRVKSYYGYDVDKVYNGDTEIIDQEKEDRPDYFEAKVTIPAEGLKLSAVMAVKKSDLTIVYKGGLKAANVMVNGTQKTPESDTSKGLIYSDIPYNASVRVEFVLTTTTDAITVVCGSAEYPLRKTINGSDVAWVLDEFKMPVEDTRIVATITSMNPIDVQVATEDLTMIYDGTPKRLKYTVIPNNLDGFKVEYKVKGADEKSYTEDAFTAANKTGEAYMARITREADATHDAFEKVVEYTIQKADIVITKEPEVEVVEENGSKVYKVSGGTAAYMRNGQPIDITAQGKFITEQVYADGQTAVTVQFKPNDTSNLKDAQVNVTLAGDDVKEYTVKIDPSSEDILTMWNGSAQIKNGVTVLEGTTITFKIKQDAHLTDADYNVVQLDGGNNVVKEQLNEGVTLGNDTYVDTDANILIFAVKVADNRKEIILAAESDDASERIKVVSYNGNIQSYDPITDMKLTTKDNDDVTGGIWTVTYTLNGQTIAEPIDVGTYTVTLLRAATEHYQEFETTATLDIKQAKLDEAGINVPIPTASRINVGQPLYYSNLTGSADIAGYYQWDVQTYPDVMKSAPYPVIFYPLNSNYEPLKLKKQVTVPITDEAIVTWYADNNGYVSIKDATGKEYYNGDAVKDGMVLTITATPYDEDNFEFESLIVDGIYIANGGTYTFGKKSIEISASFKPKSTEIIDPNSQYKVTVTESVRGAIISHPGENVVKKGSSFSFTVSTLAADANKVNVTASNGTVTKGSNGRYTVSNIQANTTVRVSLSNPTPLKVEVQKSYLNDKKYHVGSVEIAEGESTTYYYGDVITVVAYPESGVKFEKWSDGSKEQVHEIELKGDVKITATFSGVPTGIEDIESAAIYTGRGFIMVKNVANAKVTVVSISGRLQAQEEVNGDTRIDVPQGIYVVVLESGSDAKRMKVIVK